jgi:hypothetical protein
VAQTRLRAPAVTGNPVEDIKTDIGVQPASNPTSAPCIFPLDPLKLCGKLTGNIDTDLKAVVARIKIVASKDIDYAILKATAANTNTAKVRLQCLQGIKVAKDAFDGDVKDATGAIVPRPDPALITGLEDVAELADNLSPQGALLTSCAGAAQMFKMTALAVVNSIITGAVGIAAVPAGL